MITAFFSNGQHMTLPDAVTATETVVTPVPGGPSRVQLVCRDSRGVVIGQFDLLEVLRYCGNPAERSALAAAPARRSWPAALGHVLRRPPAATGSLVNKIFTMAPEA